MKYETTGEDYDREGLFTQNCACGAEHKIKTQADRDPEYYTRIHTYCSCGRELVWDLPVN